MTDQEIVDGLINRDEKIPDREGGSSDIKFRLKKGQRLRAVGAAILSMLAAAPPGDNHWEYTCGQCQRTFEVPVAKFPSSEEKEEE